MKNINLKKILVAISIVNLSFINLAFAEDAKPEAIPQEIPTLEKPFVDAIYKYTKAQIIAQFGEPAKADDIKLKDSGRVVASIWHYHNINKAEDGSYFQTTELDFIDDKVVQVVFLNNDGTERNDGGQAYELPIKPEM